MALFDFLFKGSKAEKEKKAESIKTTPGAPVQKPTAPGTSAGAASAAAKPAIAPKPGAPRPPGTVKLTPTPRPATQQPKPPTTPPQAKPTIPSPPSATKAASEEATSGDLDTIVSAIQQIEQLISEEDGGEQKAGRDRNMFPVTLKLADVAKFAAPLFASNAQVPADATVEIYIKDLYSQLSRGRVHTTLKQIAQDIPREFLRPDVDQMADKEIAVPLPLVVATIDPMELKKRTSSVAKEMKVDDIPTLFKPAAPIPSRPVKPEAAIASATPAKPAPTVQAPAQKQAAPAQAVPPPAAVKAPVAPAAQKIEKPKAEVETAKAPVEEPVAPAPVQPAAKAEPQPAVSAPQGEPARKLRLATTPPAPPPTAAPEPKVPAVQPAPAAAKPEAPKVVPPAVPPQAPVAAPAVSAKAPVAPAKPIPPPVTKEPVAETKAAPAIVPPKEKEAPRTEPKPVVPPAKPVAPAAPKVEPPPAAAAKSAPPPQPPPVPAAPPPPPPSTMAPGKITDMLLGLAKMPAPPTTPPAPVAKAIPEAPKAEPPVPRIAEPEPKQPAKPVSMPPAPAGVAPAAKPKMPAAIEAAPVPPTGRAPVPPSAPSVAKAGRVPSLMHRGIDLNTASADEITARLEGIGRAMAERIVEDRTQNGPFYALYDLARVSGIGARLFEKITGWKWHEDLYGQLNIVNQVLERWDGNLPDLNAVAARFNALSGFDACVILHRDGHLLASSWDEKSGQALEAMGPQIVKRVEQYVANVCPEKLLSVTAFLYDRVLILSQHEDIIFVGIRSPRAFNRRHLQIVQGMAMALGKRFSGLRDAATEATNPSA